MGASLLARLRFSERNQVAGGDGAGDLEFETHSRGSLDGPRLILEIWTIHKVRRVGQCRT